MYYKSNALMVGLGYEYRVGRHGWMLEYHRYEGMAESDDDFSEASNEALLGYRYYLDRSAIEFTVIENFLNMDNSTDIAFTLAIGICSNLAVLKHKAAHERPYLFWGEMYYSACSALASSASTLACRASSFSRVLSNTCCCTSNSSRETRSSFSNWCCSTCLLRSSNSPANCFSLKAGFRSAV